MAGASFSRASGIAWEEYYRAVEGRSPRPLFMDALALLPTRSADGRALVAVDLGCGDGRETIALLARGWRVFAIDSAPEAIARLRASVPPEHTARLTTHAASFHEVDLPAADFAYAGLSLPFCAPGEFHQAWQRLSDALRPEGVFAGHLFGPHDSWANTPDMTFHTRGQVAALLSGFEVEILDEEDEDGSAVSGPKHWHIFHLIARKRSG